MPAPANKALMRDFLQKLTVETVKPSFRARLPSTTASWSCVCPLAATFLCSGCSLTPPFFAVASLWHGCSLQCLFFAVAVLGGDCSLQRLLILLLSKLCNTEAKTSTLPLINNSHKISVPNWTQPLKDLGNSLRSSVPQVNAACLINSIKKHGCSKILHPACGKKKRDDFPDLRFPF